LSITITSMKLHENPLTPIILLDPDNLWAHFQSQVTEIATNRYGPPFIPNLLKPCRSADAACRELLEFCKDPDAWYTKNSIPQDGVQTARTRSRRIRAEELCLNTIETFDTPNTRLSI
jgi:hypothetical protein